MAKIGWLYYFSKYIELTETAVFALRKKYNQISFLHVYHHASMIIIWWLGIKFTAGGQGNFNVFDMPNFCRSRPVFTNCYQVNEGRIFFPSKKQTYQLSFELHENKAVQFIKHMCLLSISIMCSRALLHEFCVRISVSFVDVANTWTSLNSLILFHCVGTCTTTDMC